MADYELFSARTKKRKTKARVDNRFSSLEHDGSSNKDPASDEDCNAPLNNHNVQIAGSRSPDVFLSYDADVECCDLEKGDLNTDLEESWHERGKRKYMPSDSEYESSANDDLPKRKYIDLDFCSESSANDDPPTPMPDDLASAPCSYVSGVSGEGAALKGSALLSTTTTSTARPLAATSTRSRTKSLEDGSIITNDNQHPDLRELVRKLASHIYTMKETQQAHTSMLQTLLKKVSGVVTEAATLPKGLKFPLKTVDQLEEMETLLIDPGVRNELVNVLSEIGGRDVDECVKRVMKFIISDKLTTKINMSGRNNKKAFGPTTLFETVYRGAKKNSKTSNCTRRDVEQVVTKWLTGGRCRSGYRMQRDAGAAN